ncbi:MAG: cysteine--tRNA ligase [Cyanobacteria bacterium P01_H01_bin.74]
MRKSEAAQAKPPKYPLHFFNSSTGTVMPFHLHQKGLQQEPVKLYVCGPTVYDKAHLGHARCYTTWDVLYRLLCFLGYRVVYVRNVTDVDDKILNRAASRQVSPKTLAEENYQAFTADMTALNLLQPTQEPRATEHIADMIAGIETLIANQSAYVTPDGSVYFNVSEKADYGKLKFCSTDPDVLAKNLSDLQAGARVELDSLKHAPLDFALWKAIDPDDPNGWESPWPSSHEKPEKKGWGRPGWHMECSAMNRAIFGDQIDIHAGGADLIFPHHENEIAQSEAMTGVTPFAKFWMHNGFVNVSGEKMSKSLGNFSTVETLLQRYDCNTLRYFLLTHHYRMPVDFTDEALQSAESRLRKLSQWLKDAVTDCAFEDTPTPLTRSSDQANFAGPEASSENMIVLSLTPFLIQSVQAFQLLMAAVSSETHPAFADALAAFDRVLAAMATEDMNTAKALAELSPLFKLMKQDIDTQSRRGIVGVTLSVLNLLGFNWQMMLETSHTAPDLTSIMPALKTLVSQFCSDSLPVLTDSEQRNSDKMHPDQASYKPVDQNNKISGESPEALIACLLDARKQAKHSKDWATSDSIRDGLQSMGLMVIDEKNARVRVLKADMLVLEI